MQFGNVTLITSARVAVSPVESMTCTVKPIKKLDCTSPLIRPFELKVKPECNRLPCVSVQVYGDVPPSAVSCWE